MRSTIVLQINNNSNPAPSIASLLENTIKPNTFCIIARSDVDEKTDATIKAFLKSCCDGGSFTEEFNEKYTIAIKTKDNLKIVYILLKDYSGSDISKFAFEYFQDETDIYITANSNNVYKNTFVEQHLSKFNNNFVTAVYSDYIRSGKYIYLSSIHPLINYPIEIGDLSFRKDILQNLKTGNSADIINASYSSGLVRHIAEAIFLT